MECLFFGNNFINLCNFCDFIIYLYVYKNVWMKCCYYLDRDVVNLCSKCGKGLCMECVCGFFFGLLGGLLELVGEDILEKIYLFVCIYLFVFCRCCFWVVVCICLRW